MNKSLPGREIYNYLTDNTNEIAVKVVNLQYRLYPSYYEKYGEEGKRICIRDVGYHLPFLAEAILANDASVFTDYVEWVKTLFRGLNFQDEMMIQTLECMHEILGNESEIPEGNRKIITKFIDSGLKQMKKPVSEQDSYIDLQSPLGKIALKYLKYLLKGNRNEANALILQLVKDGVGIKEIYLEIFQNTQYEVGRLWLKNEISVAQEHFCSAATQLIMSQLYPYIFSTERKGKKCLTACIGGELHEIGIRMVADFFELDGWDTYHLGANSPPLSIIKAIQENEVDLVALSAAMPYHRNLVIETIEKIKKADVKKNLKIIVGGNAFNKDKNAWKKTGADGYAVNAQKAVDFANAISI